MLQQTRLGKKILSQSNHDLYIIPYSNNPFRYFCMLKTTSQSTVLGEDINSDSQIGLHLWPLCVLIMLVSRELPFQTCIEIGQIWRTFCFLSTQCILFSTLEDFLYFSFPELSLFYF